LQAAEERKVGLDCSTHNRIGKPKRSSPKASTIDDGW
jgi:hypothetical protein